MSTPFLKFFWKIWIFFWVLFSYGNYAQTMVIFWNFGLCRLSVFRAFSPWKGMTRSAFGQKKVLKMAKNEGLGRKKFLKILKKVFLACTFLTAIWWKNGSGDCGRGRIGGVLREKCSEDFSKIFWFFRFLSLRLPRGRHLTRQRRLKEIRDSAGDSWIAPTAL